MGSVLLIILGLLLCFLGLVTLIRFLDPLEDASILWAWGSPILGFSGAACLVNGLDHFFPHLIT